jgi:hypothetical protein
VHELILLVYLLSVCLASESGETFLMHVHSEWLVRSDADIDAKVKLMSVYKEGVRHVLTDHRCLFNINIIDVVYKIYTFSLATVCRFYDPDILLAFMLFQLLVVIVEISKLIRQDISVRRQVKSLSPKFVLHTYDVIAHAVLPCNLV